MDVERQSLLVMGRELGGLHIIMLAQSHDKLIQLLVEQQRTELVIVRLAINQMLHLHRIGRLLHPAVRFPHQ